MTTGPGTGIDVIAPGRQDRFLENRNPVFRSADIIVAPPRLSNVLAAVLKQLRVLRFALSLDIILTPPYEAPCERSQGYEESISMTEYKYPPLPVTEAFLKEITDKIVQALKPEKIFLFGSYAYGKPGKDSDVDLLIIMESSERPAKRRIQVSRLFWDRPVPMDFIVKTPSEFAERMSMGDFFIKKILTKGKVLYDKKAR